MSGERSIYSAQRVLRRKHGHALAQSCQVLTKRFDEGRLANAGGTRDADADRAAGVRQERGEQRFGISLMTGRLSDRLRDRQRPFESDQNDPEPP